MIRGSGQGESTVTTRVSHLSVLFALAVLLCSLSAPAGRELQIHIFWQYQYHRRDWTIWYQFVHAWHHIIEGRFGSGPQADLAFLV